MSYSKFKNLLSEDASTRAYAKAQILSENAMDADYDVLMEGGMADAFAHAQRGYAKDAKKELNEAKKCLDKNDKKGAKQHISRAEVIIKAAKKDADKISDDKFSEQFLAYFVLGLIPVIGTLAIAVDVVSRVATSAKHAAKYGTDDVKELFSVLGIKVTADTKISKHMVIEVYDVLLDECKKIKSAI